jgi:hypothetical protein
MSPVKIPLAKSWVGGPRRLHVDRIDAKHRGEVGSMSPQLEPAGPVPDETGRVARAAFPKGNVYMQMRDVLGAVYDDQSFSPLFAVRGRPAESPWRLALRAFGLRQARYRGLAKTRLQHVATATAINLVRLADWLNHAPRAPTRCSRFAALAPTG